MIAESKILILVLCTHNANRSQMAEGIIRNLGGDRVEVYSAGLEPREVNPNAIRVMKEKGIDISSHRSKAVSEFLGQKFNYVITVCDEAAQGCPFFPGNTTRLYWFFDDPSAFAGTENEIMAGYRRVRDQIRDKVSQWMGELRLSAN